MSDVPSELVERSDGRVVIYAAPQLRVQPQTVEGLRPTNFNDALIGFTHIAPLDATQQPVQAFAWSQSAVKLVVAAERRKPQVTVRQLLALRVEPGVVQGNITLRYDILHSGLKTLRIDIPTPLHYLLNFGNVRLQTAATQGDFTFDWVPDPRGVADEVQRRIEEYRYRMEMARAQQRAQELPDWFEMYNRLGRTARQRASGAPATERTSRA